MRFNQDVPSGNVIRAYGADGIRINDRTYPQGVILSASQVLEHIRLHDVADLTAEVIGEVMALKPEVVLLGTGVVQVFPAAQVSAAFLRLRVGFEVMDTGAACRTFNVLVTERRDVVAILLK